MFCANRHSFDQARQGYVNLYVPAGRPPRIEGDNHEMLQARRRFLESGHYSPLIDEISSLLGKPANDEIILDAGCGEGFYLRTLTKIRSSRGYGFDRARGAVKMAAGRDKENCYFVADSWQPLLLKDGSLNVILNIFAPKNPKGFHRVLRADGCLLMVTPNEAHLLAVRAKYGLLGIEQDKNERLAKQLLPYFSLAKQKSLAFTMSLDPAQLMDLIVMTPARHHLTRQQRLEIQSTDTLDVSTDFRLSLWRPNT